MVAKSNKCLYNEHMFEIREGLSIQEKLQILSDAAKYDVACTSSGVERKGKEGMLGNTKACGICHSFAADGRCISLLKVLMTNHCIYDCKYCMNRKSNDVVRTTFTPEELCQLTMEFYKRNYIEGLFLSSGVMRNPTYTMELMCETLRLLRTKYAFNGYIHVKVIPGAADELLAAAGVFADRISINMELPTADSLERLAPNKSFQTILKPMGKVRDTIAQTRLAIGKQAWMERSNGNTYLPNSIFEPGQRRIENPASTTMLPVKTGAVRSFAPAGQSTQMIVGAAGESDYTFVKTAQSLYQNYDLKRVFYSAYIPLNEDTALPDLETPVPLLREHRLYQADWLLRYYGFQADELLSEEQPNFNIQLDPKCDWALRHLEQFPVEIEKAPYDVLLRVPGIGPKSARRILTARRHGRVEFEHLKKMGVVLKRANYFITCGGRMLYHIPIEEQFIKRQLTSVHAKENWQVMHQTTQRQLSLFDDFGITV